MAEKRLCAQCAKPYLSGRKDSRFCSKQCRKKYYRNNSGYDVGISEKKAVAELWRSFKKSEVYLELKRTIEERDRRGVCLTCPFGMTGVCIRPRCGRPYAIGGDEKGGSTQNVPRLPDPETIIPDPQVHADADMWKINLNLGDAV